MQPCGREHWCHTCDIWPALKQHCGIEYHTCDAPWHITKRDWEKWICDATTCTKDAAPDSSTEAPSAPPKQT